MGELWSSIRQWNVVRSKVIESVKLVLSGATKQQLLDLEIRYNSFRPPDKQVSADAIRKGRRELRKVMGKKVTRKKLQQNMEDPLDDGAFSAELWEAIDMTFRGRKEL